MDLELSRFDDGMSRFGVVVPCRFELSEIGLLRLVSSFLFSRQVSMYSLKAKLKRDRTLNRL